MQAQQTSAAAYEALKASGVLSKQQETLLGFFSPERDYSLRELVEMTGMPANVVSARANEMRNEKLVIEFAPKRQCSITGRMVNPLRLVGTMTTAAQGGLF